MCKCPSCGYEKRTKEIETEEVIRYKSGKRKGEIKEIRPKIITVYGGDPDFYELEFKKDVDVIVASGNESRKGFGCYSYDDRGRVDLKCCPQCGTVFVSNLWSL